MTRTDTGSVVAFLALGWAVGSAFASAELGVGVVAGIIVGVGVIDTTIPSEGANT